MRVGRNLVNRSGAGTAHYRPGGAGRLGTHTTGALLPDLGMDRTRNFIVDTTVPGQTRLRFTTSIINIGDGPFEARGHSLSNGEMLVDQNIFNSNGTKTPIATQSKMYFAGDGHTHWHIRDLATYELQNSNATIKRTSEKHGFCAFDNTAFNLALPDAPQTAEYPMGNCGNAADTTVTTGISIGWADVYRDTLPDQYIDISGLPSGEYNLTATVDDQGYFRERCEDNNSSTTVLMITGSDVSVVTAGLCVVGLHHHADADADAHPVVGEPVYRHRGLTVQERDRVGLPAGITAGCTPTKFCPLATVTREQMASFLVRGLDLPPTGKDFFTDDESSAHEADINRLAASGITGGCAAGRFCPSASVTREQMASFLARGLKLSAASIDYFSDDETSIHEADINRLAKSGITGGCAPGRYCPRSVVTREQMAAFLYRGPDSVIRQYRP